RAAPQDVCERRQAPALPPAQAQPGHERVHAQVKSCTEQIEVPVGAADLAHDVQPPGPACGHLDVPAEREGFSVDVLVADDDVAEGDLDFRRGLLRGRRKCEAECDADDGHKTGTLAELLKHVHLVVRSGRVSRATATWMLEVRCDGSCALAAILRKTCCGDRQQLTFSDRDPSKEQAGGAKRHHPTEPAAARRTHRRRPKPSVWGGWRRGTSRSPHRGTIRSPPARTPRHRCPCRASASARRNCCCSGPRCLERWSGTSSSSCRRFPK